jgi:1,4-dihydroxy-6-naphthoate synthase
MAEKSRLNIAISPCPNDVWIFGAMMKNLIPLPWNLNFTLVDIATLNELAISGSRHQFIKLSFGVVPFLNGSYTLLDCGSAMGHGCGPLLIKKPETVLTEQSHIAIPGETTSASRLLTMFLPQYKKKSSFVFSDIIPAISAGKVDAGVIIHESRFTYKNAGLVSVIDLGELWEKHTSLPVPLGGIFCKSCLNKRLIHDFNKAMRESLSYAASHPQEILNICAEHAQEMDENVMKQHIHLYVNEHTMHLNESGKQALKELVGEIQFL